MNDPSDPPESPSPSPSPSPSRSRGGAAAGSSTASAGSSPFVADAGHFDPDAPAPEPSPIAGGGAQLHALPTPVIEWEEESVRSILTAKGAALHMLIAVDKDSDEWRYTDNDLQAIAPPLTRILNRYDATRAAAGTGDEIAVVIGLSGYIGRSVRQRKQDISELEAAGPEPASGVQTAPIPVDVAAAAPPVDLTPPTALT